MECVCKIVHLPAFEEDRQDRVGWDELEDVPYDLVGHINECNGWGC